MHFKSDALGLPEFHLLESEDRQTMFRLSLDSTQAQLLPEISSIQQVMFFVG